MNPSASERSHKSENGPLQWPVSFLCDLSGALGLKLFYAYHKENELVVYNNKQAEPSWVSFHRRCLRIRGSKDLLLLQVFA